MFYIFILSLILNLV